MSSSAEWLLDPYGVEGVVPVLGYDRNSLAPEQVVMMERAAGYNADAVFFSAPRNGRSPVAQALIFDSDGPADDPDFGETHRRIWSWGGVPLIYRKAKAVIQLFRCSHRPDFVSPTGVAICKPYKFLKTAAGISNDAWWDASLLYNGTLWDDPKVCGELLSAELSAHKRLFKAVRALYGKLEIQAALPPELRQKLLILSLLIAYLEERRVLLQADFGVHLPGASTFFEVLANGKALVNLLADLESTFNGNVFTLSQSERATLEGSDALSKYAAFVEGHQEASGQRTLWKLYSFKDLPIELISNIYQLFVSRNSTVYTPPFLVRLMLDEALNWKRLDKLQDEGQVILDPSCGSGVFLVEAYKRLVLHWRLNNEWKRPDENILKSLLSKVHGIDLEPGAVKLAAFSLYLALCDALEPEDIRSSVRLFPQLDRTSLHTGCFFDAVDSHLIKEPVGAIVGNPPFESKLTTPGAQRSYDRYQSYIGPLPDKQLAYLFLHEAMGMLADSGVLSMLQQYNFLYNEQSVGFRTTFITKWEVREILDFISVRGLFSADTKVIAVVAEAASPRKDTKILHATFRRTGRVDAEQGFDIDFYDLHWLPRTLALANDRVWRTNLLGGGRALDFVSRLAEMQTLTQYAKDRGWDHGEGYIEGKTGKRDEAPHLTGAKLLPSGAIVGTDIDRSQITTVEGRLFKTAYTPSRYTPPMLLIREQMDLDYALWTESYLAYKNQVVGICADQTALSELQKMFLWFSKNHKVLKAYVAAISVKMFTQKATTLSEIDILSLPYPESGTLDVSPNEQIIVDDIADYYCDLVRLGEGSNAFMQGGRTALPVFSQVVTKQINAIYKETPLQALDAYSWPGVICQPFVFGNGMVDWSGVDELKGRLDRLLRERDGESLQITRIGRIYDGSFMFLLKPDRLRYWLRSLALRDADDILADLRTQGY